MMFGSPRLTSKGEELSAVNVKVPKMLCR